MIDEQVLEALFREAGEEITVPADGPDHVLAARSAPVIPRFRLRWWGRTSPEGVRRRLPRPGVNVAGGLLLAALVLVIGVVANLSGSGSGSSKGASVGASAAAGSGAAGSSGTVAGPAAREPKSGAGAPGAGGVAVPPKVIQTGSVSLQVAPGQVNPTMARLTSAASALGGFVGSSNTQSGPGPATGDITLRVPAANFDPLLNVVRAIGTVTSVSTSSQDVTSQYADLGAQLQSLEDTRNQLEQIMSRATTIGDVISVEQQISDLESQIQQLQSQLQVLDNQASYGTLAVHVTESSKSHAVAAPSGLDRAWDHTRHTFSHGLESVVSALGGIAVFLLCVAALALVTRLGWTVMRRRMV